MRSAGDGRNPQKHELAFPATACLAALTLQSGILRPAVRSVSRVPTGFRRMCPFWAVCDSSGPFTLHRLLHAVFPQPLFKSTGTLKSFCLRAESALSRNGIWAVSSFRGHKALHCVLWSPLEHRVPDAPTLRVPDHHCRQGAHPGPHGSLAQRSSGMSLCFTPRESFLSLGAACSESPRGCLLSCPEPPV